MIVGFVKTMQTRIIGQDMDRENAQQYRTDGFTYSFLTNVTRKQLSWDEIELVCFKWLDKLRAYDAKDMELSLDLQSGQYSLRFTSCSELPEDAYATEVIWEILDVSNGETYTASAKPTEYINDIDKKYEVRLNVELLSLDEVGELTEESE